MLTCIVIFIQKGVLLNLSDKEAFIFLFLVEGRVLLVVVVVRGGAWGDLGMGKVRAEQLLIPWSQMGKVKWCVQVKSRVWSSMTLLDVSCKLSSLDLSFSFQ